MLIGPCFTCGYSRKCCRSLTRDLMSMNVIIDPNKYILDISRTQKMIRMYTVGELDEHQGFCFGAWSTGFRVALGGVGGLGQLKTGPCQGPL